MIISSLEYFRRLEEGKWTDIGDPLDGAPHLVAGFALHYGTVAYGNIGSGDRLDFTVIGRDVNLTSRIERLCREVGQQLIMSGEFVAHLREPMFEIGHFALRGVPQMQLLFGLPPAP